MSDKEKIPSYKPIPKRSKFLKPNKEGQIPANCVSFNWCGKHCWYADGDYEETATDCKVLKGEYCKEYRGEYIKWLI